MSTEVTRWGPPPGPDDGYIDAEFTEELDDEPAGTGESPAEERSRRFAAAPEPELDDDEDRDGELVRYRAPLGELVLYAPVNLLSVVEEHGGRALAGALAFYCLDWWPWARDLAHADRLDTADTISGAGGKNLNLAHRKDHHERVDRRMRRSGQLATLAISGLLAGSVAGYSPMPWVALALTGVALLLGVGLFAHDHKRAEWSRRLLLVPLVILLPLGITAWRWEPAAVAFVLVTGVCWFRGGRVQPPDTPVPGGGPPLPRRDWQTLWATAHRVLAARGKVAERVGNARPISAEGEEIGVSLGMRCTDAILPEDLAALERDLGFPVGGVRWFPDRGQAGSGALNLRWADVLDRPGQLPAAAPYGSGSVHRAKRIARGQLGAPLLLNRLRKHILVLGASGSGKTSLGWRLLDDIAENCDEKPWGIDLRRKNLIAPYLPMFEGRVAYTVEDAEVLLDRFQAEIDRRVARIAEKLEDADEDSIPDENWIPTADPGHEQLTLIIDELTSFTQHRVLREKLALIEETGRQAACVVVLLTPDLATKKIGDSSIFDQPQVKIVMSTSQYDIKEMFGPGAAAAGWGLPATWERPRDAGKLLISSDEHLNPEVFRADRLEVEDIIARRKWRNGRQRAQGAREPSTATPDLDDNGDEIVDAEVVSDEEITRLDVLRRAIELCGDRPGLPVAEAREAFTADEVSVLRDAAPAVPQYHRGVTGRPRSHPRNMLVSALQG